MLRPIAPGVHVADVPLRFFGVELGTRMTVLQLEGGLLLHSPVPLDPALLEPLGTPRWVFAPSKLHHLYAKPWIDRGLEAWGAPGLPDKRPDLTLSGIAEPGPTPFGDEVAWLPLRSFPITNEVALLHRPSGTLIVADLVFHVPPTAPWLTRAAMAVIGGYPGCCTTALEWVGMKRSLARREIGAIADWPFDRIVMAHGAVLESGGQAAWRRAYAWLRLPERALSERR